MSSGPSITTKDKDVSSSSAPTTTTTTSLKNKDVSVSVSNNKASTTTTTTTTNFATLNINNLYRGKSLEQTKPSAPKHGLQSLGKVGNIRPLSSSTTITSSSSSSSSGTTSTLSPWKSSSNNQQENENSASTNNISSSSSSIVTLTKLDSTSTITTNKANESTWTNNTKTSAATLAGGDPPTTSTIAHSTSSSSLSKQGSTTGQPPGQVPWTGGTVARGPASSAFPPLGSEPPPGPLRRTSGPTPLLPPTEFPELGAEEPPPPSPKSPPQESVSLCQPVPKSQGLPPPVPTDRMMIPTAPSSQQDASYGPGPSLRPSVKWNQGAAPPMNGQHAPVLNVAGQDPRAFPPTFPGLPPPNLASGRPSASTSLGYSQTQRSGYHGSGGGGSSNLGMRSSTKAGGKEGDGQPPPAKFNASIIPSEKISAFDEILEKGDLKIDWTAACLEIDYEQELNFDLDDSLDMLKVSSASSKVSSASSSQPPKGPTERERTISNESFSSTNGTRRSFEDEFTRGQLNPAHRVLYDPRDGKQKPAAPLVGNRRRSDSQRSDDDHRNHVRGPPPGVPVPNNRQLSQPPPPIQLAPRFSQKTPSQPNQQNQNQSRSKGDNRRYPPNHESGPPSQQNWRSRSDEVNNWRSQSKPKPPEEDKKSRPQVPECPKAENVTILKPPAKNQVAEGDQVRSEEGSWRRKDDSTRISTSSDAHDQHPPRRTSTDSEEVSQGLPAKVDLLPGHPVPANSRIIVGSPKTTGPVVARVLAKSNYGPPPSTAAFGNVPTVKNVPSSDNRTSNDGRDDRRRNDRKTESDQRRNIPQNDRKPGPDSKRTVNVRSPESENQDEWETASESSHKGSDSRKSGQTRRDDRRDNRRRLGDSNQLTQSMNKMSLRDDDEDTESASAKKLKQEKVIPARTTTPIRDRKHSTSSSKGHHHPSRRQDEEKLQKLSEQAFGPNNKADTTSWVKPLGQAATTVGQAAKPRMDIAGPKSNLKHQDSGVDIESDQQTSSRSSPGDGTDKKKGSVPPPTRSTDDGAATGPLNTLIIENSNYRNRRNYDRPQQPAAFDDKNKKFGGLAMPPSTTSQPTQQRPTSRDAQSMTWVAQQELDQKIQSVKKVWEDSTPIEGPTNYPDKTRSPARPSGHQPSPSGHQQNMGKPHQYQRSNSGGGPSPPVMAMTQMASPPLDTQRQQQQMVNSHFGPVGGGSGSTGHFTLQQHQQMTAMAQSIASHAQNIFNNQQVSPQLQAFAQQITQSGLQGLQLANFGQQMQAHHRAAASSLHHHQQPFGGLPDGRTVNHPVGHQITTSHGPIGPSQMSTANAMMKQQQHHFMQVQQHHQQAAYVHQFMPPGMGPPHHPQQGHPSLQQQQNQGFTGHYGPGGQGPPGVMTNPNQQQYQQRSVGVRNNNNSDPRTRNRPF